MNSQGVDDSSRRLRIGRDFTAAVFDMDGLMFDTERLYFRAMNEVGSGFGLNLPEALLHSLIGRGWTDSRKLLRDHLGEAFPLIEFEAATERWMHAHLSQFGVPHKGGLREILDHLRREGVRLAVATSTQNPKATRKLTAGGIIGCFEHVVTGDQVERGKPHPEIYLEALRRLGVEAASAIALEDSPNGLRAAVSAGLRTYLVPDLAPVPREVRCLAFHVAADLSEVARLLLPPESA